MSWCIVMVTQLRFVLSQLSSFLTQWVKQNLFIDFQRNRLVLWQELSGDDPFTSKNVMSMTDFLTLSHFLRPRWQSMTATDFSGNWFLVPTQKPISHQKWRCPWCNGYRRRKWTRRHEFKSWTRLIAFHIALIPLGKVWIQLFSLQLWLNSRID